MYELQAASGSYGNQQYLTHTLKGDTPEGDRYLFAQRVPSYGLVQFGSIARNRSKAFTPLDHNIKSSVELRSINALTQSAAGQFEIYLYENNNLVSRQIIKSDTYIFPRGTILEPDSRLIIKSIYDTTQLLLSWSPVHVLSYIEV